MNALPISFNNPMVRAILAGSKTQTRRIAKPLGYPDYGNIYTPNVPAIKHYSMHTTEIACHYGRIGEHLWVREAWACAWHVAQRKIFYRATDQELIGMHPDFMGWLPPRNMPQQASRIMLEITGLRIERLQDISKADAIAEGIHHLADDPIESYKSLWEYIYGDGSWTMNPLVWVIDFRQIDAATSAAVSR